MCTGLSYLLRSLYMLHFIMKLTTQSKNHLPLVLDTQHHLLANSATTIKDEKIQ